MYIMIRGVGGIGGRGARKLGCNRTMNCSENMTSKNGIINGPRQQDEELAADVGLEKPSESVA
jgi:hypothetical protein